MDILDQEGNKIPADDDGRNAVSTDKDRALTHKQKHFATLLLQGKSVKEAYVTAYNCHSQKDSTIYSSAYRLQQTPNVKAFIERENRRMVERDLRSAGERRHWIVQRLMKEAEYAETDSTRVRALELLGKMYDVRLFTDQIDVEDNRKSSLDLHMQIMGKLERMLPSDNGE